MKEKDLIQGFFGKALAMNEEQLNGLYEGEGEERKLKADALDSLLKADKQRVGQIKTNYKTEIFNDAFGDATKEVSSKWEKKLTSKFGLEEDLKGDELIDAVYNYKVPTPKGDDIKTHKTYLDLEKRYNEDMSAKDQMWEDEWKKRESEWNDKFMFYQVKEQAYKEFDLMNPVLSSNKEVARNQRERFADLLSHNKFKTVDGDILVLKPDGSRLEDEYHNPVNFKSFVQGIVSNNYDLPKQEQRGATGNENTPVSNGEADISKLELAYMDAKTDEERQTIAKQLDALSHN